MKIAFQGGRSRTVDGRENLAIRLLDADSGTVLAQALPPGTHVLTTRRIPLSDIKGQTIRLELVDENTDASYAWIGLESVELIEDATADPRD
jgi:hypothetical protein